MEQQVLKNIKQQEIQVLVLGKNIIANAIN